MSRTPYPLDREPSVIAALQMIAAHVDRPCPTRREVSEWTGVPRRKVWLFLSGLVERGLVELEVMDPTDYDAAKRRRMRVANGQWTDWTARGPGISRRGALMLEAMT